MIPVTEADRLLSGLRISWPDESVALEAATGRILREDLRADRPYPAQDRSRMDGIAVLHEHWIELEKTSRAFAVAGLSRAGDPRQALSRTAACLEIMTGAPVPEGCDTVIPYEDLHLADGAARVREGVSVKPGQFVHREASDCAEGDVLVPAGTRVNAAVASIAASVGKERLLVARRPRIAIVATGDELVDVGGSPLPHQLRASHGAALRALLAPWAEVTLHRCGDDPTAITEALRAALRAADLVLATGGVSAGKFDAVPDAFAALGVERLFHKIAQKPGKPLWVGMAAGSPPKPAIPVFGLPGNPVSALVCARRYVLPLVWSGSGWEPPRLQADYRAPVPASKLTQFLPVRLEENDALRRAVPAAINGSGDFAGLGASDGFIEVPVSETPHEPGEKFSFFAWFS